VAVNGSAYRDLLALPGVRRALWLGLALRIPLWAAGVVLTLHVVSHLGRSYTAAGLVTTVYTLAIGLSGPWRGRLLDRVGLRRTLAPSIAVQVACWSVAPLLPYWALFPVVALAGLYAVPSFSLTRQMMMAASPLEQRTAVLSLESVAVELSFMIGPALGVLTVTWWDTPVALAGSQLTGAAAAGVLWLADPPVQQAHEQDPTLGEAPVRPSWMSARVLALLAISSGATFLLTGSDVSIVAALREMGRQEWIGVALAIWGAGSAVGGLLYGALHRPVPAAWLLAGLALTTLPAALAGGPVVFAVLIFLAGPFCAPTLTATVDELSRLVPARNRGEVMGWQASAATGGSAMGAPVAGFAIDHGGWQAGLTSTAAVGLAISLMALSATAARRRRSR